MYCLKCRIIGAQSGSTFCNYCGEKLVGNTVVCPHSVEFTPHDTYVWSKFCDVCGKPVQETVGTYVDNELKKENKDVSTNS